MPNVSPGDMARVVKSYDGLSVGKVVEVCSLGEHGPHEQLGIIWLCRSKDVLTTFMGAQGHFAHFADDWLRKIEPPEEPLPNQASLDINQDNRLVAEIQE